MGRRAASEKEARLVGGLTRKPVQVKPVKPRPVTPTPKKVLVTEDEIDRAAFGKKCEPKK